MSNLDQQTISQAQVGVSQRSFSSLEGLIGRFAARELKRVGLEAIALKLANHIQLEREEIERICNKSEPQFLAKLVEIAEGAEKRQVRLRSVFYLPLASLVEEGGISHALQVGRERFKHLTERTPRREAVYLAIDRWTGRHELDELLDAIQCLTVFSTESIPVVALGPSSREIKRLLEQYSGIDQDTLLSRLKSHGISSIEGGLELSIHLKAASQGFMVAVGQEVVKGELESSEQRGKQGSRQVCFSSQFITELLAVRESLLPSGRFTTWFPWSRLALDSHDFSSQVSLGAQIIRAIAVGRLVLPELEYIRAPLTLLGTKLAHVALAFGANDLGFAAVDSETAKALGVQGLSKVQAVVERHENLSEGTYPGE